VENLNNRVGDFWKEQFKDRYIYGIPNKVASEAAGAAWQGGGEAVDIVFAGGQELWKYAQDLIRKN